MAPRTFARLFALAHIGFGARISYDRWDLQKVERRKGKAHICPFAQNSEIEGMLMSKTCLPLLLFSLSSAQATSALRGARQHQRSVQNTVSITGFVLINADSNQEIEAIENGSVLNLSSLPTTSLNIAAVTEGPGIDSVSFAFNDNANFRTERVAPYALCGDSGGDYFSCGELTVDGVFTITASAKSGNDIVSTKTTTFTIVTSAPTTLTPTLSPTAGPTLAPSTAGPTLAPSTAGPTLAPSTAGPTLALTTVQPTQAPTGTPSTAQPSQCPTHSPTTGAPTTAQPTDQQTQQPTTAVPTLAPSTGQPTQSPTTAAPSSAEPTQLPVTSVPTQLPTTISPSTAYPVQSPTTDTPSSAAPTSAQPTQTPTTVAPSSFQPTEGSTTTAPTQSPTTIAPSTVQPTQTPISPPPTVSPTTTSPTMTPTESSNLLPWVESFDGLPNGSTTDVDGTAWAAIRGNGDFNVENGELVVNNGGDEGVFQTDPIDIAGLSVDISVQIYSTGPLEDYQDYVRVYAIVDGGAEQLLGEVKGVQSTAETITGTGLTGSTLVIVMRAYVSYFDEFYHMDNLRVDSAGSAPTNIPTPAPTLTPVGPPTILPQPTLPLCKTPKFVGGWQGPKKYPIPVAESQGAIVENDFIIVSGFSNGYGQATSKNYALDMTDPNADWRPIADLPVSDGITHGAFVVVGPNFYMCGGFLGGHPGPHIDTCLVYNHPTNTWSYFDSLPEGRAGGGLVYSPLKNALVFSAGAERPQGSAYTDYQHTWMYSFGNPQAGWVEKADIPYLSNHMSSVTTKDQAGNERHFFLAGQLGEDEWSGNLDDNYEWDVNSEIWITRKNLPFTRGHASSSTNQVNCGFIIAAGSTNEFGKTGDVSYYDVPSDTWTKVGDLPNSINTPVCDIDVSGGWYYCFTGWATGKFATKIQIEL